MGKWKEEKVRERREERERERANLGLWMVQVLPCGSDESGKAFE